MKSNEKDILILDQYIKRELDSNQIAEIKQRLKDEADLNDDYEFLKKVAADARLAKLSEVMTSIKGMENEYQGVTKKVPHGSKSEWLKYVIAIVLLGFILYVGMKYMSSKPKDMGQYADLIENRFDEELILHETFRAATQVDELTQEQRRAFELYSIREFEKAIPLLDTLWTTQKDTLALFYLGVSKIGNGEIKKGEEILKLEELNKYPKIIK